jgi:hypothetical protein
VTALGRPSKAGTSATAVSLGFDIAQGMCGRSVAPASGSQGSERDPGRSRHGAPGLKHRFLPSPSALAPPSGGRDNGPLSRTPAIAFRAVRLRSVIPEERTGVGRRLRHRGCPVLLARCYISSIGLTSVSRQVCGRHSLTPSGLPARAGGPGRRGCRIRSRPSAATGPACRRGTAGAGPTPSVP